MAYDDVLAGRIRHILNEQPNEITERKMFGGLAFMLRGNMCCGVIEDRLMVRVGPDEYQAALAEPYAREMDFTGKALTGFVYVAPEGCESEEQLESWVEKAVAFAASLPPK